MLLRSSSTPTTGIQAVSEFNSGRSVWLSQLHVAVNGDGKWLHNDVHPRLGRTLSEVDSHSSLSSNGTTSRMGLKRRSRSLDLCRNLSTDGFQSNGLLDKDLEEEFDDSDTQISIGFQSAGDPHEESPEKIKATFQTHGDEGRHVSGRRIEDLMGGWVYEATRVNLVCDSAAVGSKTETSFVNGGFGGEDGGGFSGGGEYRGRGSGFGSDSDNMDSYYKEMLQADPDNPLLLTNYARFLQEVQHNLKKAEEYYGRAILASPGDGDILSLYANLIWDVYKDAPRAESYFDQAIEAAPDGCNVLGSYAHFLWNAEDDEEDKDTSHHQKMVPPTYIGTVSIAAT